MPEGCYQPEDLDKLVPDINLNNTTPLPEVSIEEEDIASIIYTSGTTGFSKGVVLTHKNLVWDARQCRTIQPVDETYRFVSILPMAHTYENTLGLLLPLMFRSTSILSGSSTDPQITCSGNAENPSYGSFIRTLDYRENLQVASVA